VTSNGTIGGDTASSTDSSSGPPTKMSSIEVASRAKATRRDSASGKMTRQAARMAGLIGG
jgi:hypothetical protein